MSHTADSTDEMPEVQFPHADAPSRTWRARSPILAGIIAVIWLLALSSWLGVSQGAPIATRRDVFFDSDSAMFTTQLTSPTAKWLALSRYFVHPLEATVWPPIARGLTTALKAAGFGDDSPTIATRLLVSVVAAIGIAAIFALAVEQGTPLAACWLLLACYLLSSYNVLVAIPDHFGLSSGWLAASFALWATPRRSFRRTAAFLGFSAAAAGTTVTNAVLFVLCVARERSRSYRAAGVWLVAGLLSLLLVMTVASRASYSVSSYMRGFTNGRMTDHPALAGLYAATTLFTPIVAPVPYARPIAGGNAMVSYEPLDLRRYTWLQTVGVLAWLIALAFATVHAVRDPHTRPFSVVLLAWIAFNAGFHNAWGDEFFLYAPHWGWALMALAMLGLKRMPFPWLVTLTLPLMAAQVSSLVAIRGVLLSIAR